MSKFRWIAFGVPIFLALGLITGVSRAGLFDSSLSYHHGILMLNGFAGGMITVERFLSRKDPWTFIGLLALVTGTALYLAGINEGLILVAFNISIIFLKEVFSLKTENLHFGVYQIIGFISWLLANLKFYLSGFYPATVPFWELFILLMIISTRLKKMEKNDSICLWLIILIFGSLWVGFHGTGKWIFAVGLIGVSIRLGYLEIKQNLHRVNLIFAYGWLMVSGLALIFSDRILYSYDLAIHAFLLGFLFTMIFLNASEAFLQKLGSKIFKTYPRFWTFMLSFGLIVRLAGGDLLEIQNARVIGSLLNVLTITLFILFMFIQIIRSRIFARKLQ